MKCMQMLTQRQSLVAKTLSTPECGDEEVLIRVQACGVCRTDLHVLDGDLTKPKLPLVLGHEIVGTVEAVGSKVESISVGQRVGYPWLGKTCMRCWYCTHQEENLCDSPQFTGYTRDGGYAEYVAADSRYCFPIDDSLAVEHAAPLMCAGLIGWRTLKFAGDAKRVGIYGFGAAAHIIAQVAIKQGREVFAFTSPGDATKQEFARKLGAKWAGGSDQKPPEELDAALLFAPVGSLVPAALGHVRKGGIVVCGGIHMTEIPSFSYDLLWGERSIKSVANLTREDGHEFLKVAAEMKIETTVQTFPLERANEALNNLRAGKLTGAAVLIP